MVITSSCSTDETIVADSDEEIETVASIPSSVALDTIQIGESESKRKANGFIVMSDDQGAEGHISDTNIESLHNESIGDIITNRGNERVETSGQIACSEDRYCSKVARGMKDDDSDTKNSDIIYSQDLVIRDLNLPAKARSSRNNTVINFKRFRKVNEIYFCLPINVQFYTTT